MTQNPFDKLFARGADLRVRLALEARQYEDTLVSFLLQRLHRGRGLRAQLLALQAKRSDPGDRLLRLATYNAAFPRFPFVLGASRLRGMPLDNGKETPADYCVHRDQAAVEPARFKRFGRVPFVVAFTQFQAVTVPGFPGQAMALAFPRKGFLRGMVIHDDATETYWTRGLSWVYKTDTGRVYVQPFQALVDAIAAADGNWPTLTEF